MSQTPEPKLTVWHSFPLRKAKAGEPVIGSFGGHPRGVRATDWPRCGVCNSPMCHMGQLDAGPWLNLGGFQRMSLFICHATGGRCEDWDPSRGANRVVLHRERDENLYDGPPTVRVYRRVKLTVGSAFDEKALMGRVKREEVDMTEALRTLQHDKLGGGAVWLHGDATPQSPSTGKPMRMLLQLTTDIVKFDITPGGMAYVFLDSADGGEGAGRLLWQGG